MIANSDEFSKRNLAKVGYRPTRFEDGSLEGLCGAGRGDDHPHPGRRRGRSGPPKDGQRAKNMFALGLLSWMYGRPIETSENFIREKFAASPMSPRPTCWR